MYPPTNMSITSTVTTLAELVSALGNDAVIATWICILITTWGDGSPLDPTSFGEEDAIGLCVGLGQEHPEGVLWVSDAKNLLAFSSGPSMMAPLQCFAAAMSWHDEPVWLHI